jgi:transcriptional regulator with XRE-family HTH domain
MKFSKMQICRLRNAYTQVLAAEELGISECYLSQIENGKVVVSDEMLVKMSKLYDCHKYELLEQKGDENL